MSATLSQNLLAKKSAGVCIHVNRFPISFVSLLLPPTVSVMDSSRVSTCLISMLLIVYGSFRSLNMEQEQQEKERRRQSESSTNLLTGEPIQIHESQSKFATLDTFHALCLPLGASVSLLVMFFFFDSMQMLFAVCTASKCREMY